MSSVLVLLAIAKEEKEKKSNSQRKKSWRSATLQMYLRNSVSDQLECTAGLEGVERFEVESAPMLTCQINEI